MHAPPPFQITVRRFGVWRWGCSTIAAGAGVVTVVWATQAWRLHAGWIGVSALLALAASIGLLVHAWRISPTSLRWDGQAWNLGPASTLGQEPLAGRLDVAVDFGSWMLLHFVAAGARRGLWLPVQRRGHETAWHRMRATVYCARPVFLPTSVPF